MSDELARLAESIRRRNEADETIAAITGRPAEKGHIGEFIASRVFAIDLAESAVQKGADGTFTEGPLRGKSVNVKFYGKQEGMLDIRIDALPDYFLVLTGSKSSVASSRNLTRSLVVEAAYLFQAASLVEALKKRGLKIGVATSVAQRYWRDTEIYPEARNRILHLSDEQRRLLALFGSVG